MARFINKGTDKKPKYVVDTKASTTPNEYGTAKKREVVLQAEQAKTETEAATKGGK